MAEKKSFMSLEELRELLKEYRPGVERIALEPIPEGKESDEVWSFRVDTGAIDRPDGKVAAGVVAFREDKGYYQFFIVEEPGKKSEGSLPKIEGKETIGQVVIPVFNGIIVVRENSGLNGLILEPKGLGSITRIQEEFGVDIYPGEGAEFRGFVESNPQRIRGVMAVYTLRLAGLPVKKAGEIYMSIEEFAKISSDGRALAALMKSKV